MLKIVTRKNSKNEVCKLYRNLIEPKVDKLKNAKGKGRDTRSNILNILKKIKPSIFDGYYYQYFDKRKLAEERIAKRTKLRRQIGYS